MKILIVEDNQQIRRMLRDYISDIADSVYECDDGNQAFGLYTTHNPDWVLMDWEMNQMDGISATKQIISEFPDARICMVTAYKDAYLREEALNAGACDFILKDELSGLKKILTRKQAA